MNHVVGWCVDNIRGGNANQSQRYRRVNANLIRSCRPGHATDHLAHLRRRGLECLDGSQDPDAVAKMDAHFLQSVVCHLIHHVKIDPTSGGNMECRKTTSTIPPPVARLVKLVWRCDCQRLRIRQVLDEKGRRFTPVLCEHFRIVGQPLADRQA